MSVRILQGDCRRAMRLMAARGVTVDSIVTDPPYHLTSIVKRFGRDGAAPAKDRDGLYKRASAGFMGKQWDGGDIAFDPKTWALAWRVLKPGGHLLAFGGTRGFHRLACAIEDAGFEIRDTIMYLYGSGFPKSHDVGKKLPEWKGFGTALKPAHEPIVFARKPLSESSVAANVLAHGTGAINVDGCRIETDESTARTQRGNHDATSFSIVGNGVTGGADGRWPANVCHDGSDEVEAAFAAFGERPACMSPSDATPEGRILGGSRSQGNLPMDSGTAARFFYSAKAGPDDRFGSKHPTVKPIALMRWLVRLVTPPQGTVLDPFAGSGTTGIACMAEGLHAVLVEREAEYVADINARLAHYRGDGAHSLAAKARNRKQDDFGPLFSEAVE